MEQSNTHSPENKKIQLNPVGALGRETLPTLCENPIIIILAIEEEGPRHRVSVPGGRHAPSTTHITPSTSRAAGDCCRPILQMKTLMLWEGLPKASSN